MAIRWLLILLMITACGKSVLKYPIKELKRPDIVQPKPVLADPPHYGNKIV